MDAPHIDSRDENWNNGLKVGKSGGQVRCSEKVKIKSGVFAPESTLNFTILSWQDECWGQVRARESAVSVGLQVVGCLEKWRQEMIHRIHQCWKQTTLTHTHRTSLNILQIPTCTQHYVILWIMSCLHLSMVSAHKQALLLWVDLIPFLKDLFDQRRNDNSDYKFSIIHDSTGNFLKS